MFRKNVALKLGGLLAVAALLTGLSACTSDDTTDIEEATDAGDASTSPETPEELPEEEPSETPESDDTSDEPPSGSSIEVTSEGSGPIGLTYTGTLEDDSETVSGKLVTGPGACLSLTNNSQPELILFADETEFVLRGDRPSATGSFGQVYVGDQIEFSAVPMSKADISSIPDRCAQGSADRVLLVAE